MNQLARDLRVRPEQSIRTRSIPSYGFHVKQFRTQELLTSNGARFLIRWQTRSFPAQYGPYPEGVVGPAPGMPTAASFEAVEVEDRKGIARFFIHGGMPFPDWMRGGIEGLDLNRVAQRHYCFGFDVNQEESLRQKMEAFVGWCSTRCRFSLNDLEGMWNRMIEEKFTRGGRRSPRRRRSRSHSFGRRSRSRSPSRRSRSRSRHHNRGRRYSDGGRSRRDRRDSYVRRGRRSRSSSLSDYSH